MIHRLSTTGIAALGMTAALLSLAACKEEKSETAAPKMNGFAQICQVFKQAKEAGQTSAQQLNKNLDTLLDNQLSESDNAHIAWLAIRNAIPEQRYMLFKTAAEETLSKNWSCPAMDELAQKL